MGNWKIPDLRRGYPNDGGKPDDKGPPSDETLREIAEKHGFIAVASVVEQLKVRWEWWQRDMGIGPYPTGHEIRRYLSLTAKLADQLEEALVRGGGLGPRLLSEAIPRPTLDTSLLIKQLHKLSLAANIAARAVEPSKPGPRFRRERNNLIAKLWAIWLEENPSNARISQSDEYGGKFFLFVEGVFALFGIKNVSNDALGKAIEVVLKKSDVQHAADRNSIPEFRDLISTNLGILAA